MKNKQVMNKKNGFSARGIRKDTYAMIPFCTSCGPEGETKTKRNN
jgi:hypothetical protein